MAKKEISLVSMVLTLFLVTAISATALGYIFELTKDPIAKAERDFLYKQINVVVPGASDAEIKTISVMAIDGKTDKDSLYFYQVYKDDKLLGTAVKSYTNKGFSGYFEIIIGFDSEGKILDVNVLSHKETPGLGDKMSKDVSDWNNQFKDQDPASYKLVVKKDGGDVDAITAATISSRAFCDAMQRAYDTFINFKNKGGNK